MNRSNHKKFSGQEYAAKELVAELGAAFLCAELQINPVEKAYRASYIASWITLLEDDKKHIFSAASEASKAASYLQGLQPTP